MVDIELDKYTWYVILVHRWIEIYINLWWFLGPHMWHPMGNTFVGLNVLRLWLEARYRCLSHLRSHVFLGWGRDNLTHSLIFVLTNSMYPFIGDVYFLYALCIFICPLRPGMPYVHAYAHVYDMLWSCIISFIMYTLFHESAPLNFDPISVEPGRVWI